MNSYKDCPKGQKVFLVPPGIQSLMSGVQYASQGKNGIITLKYTDGTEESVPASAPIKELSSFEENFFSVVDYVQSFRKTGAES